MTISFQPTVVQVDNSMARQYAIRTIPDIGGKATHLPCIWVTFSATKHMDGWMDGWKGKLCSVINCLLDWKRSSFNSIHARNDDDNDDVTCPIQNQLWKPTLIDRVWDYLPKQINAWHKHVSLYKKTNLHEITDRCQWECGDNSRRGTSAVHSATDTEWCGMCSAVI